MPRKYRTHAERKAGARAARKRREEKQRAERAERRAAQAEQVAVQCRGITTRKHHVHERMDPVPVGELFLLKWQCRRTTRHESGLCHSCRAKEGRRSMHVPLKTALKIRGLS